VTSELRARLADARLYLCTDARRSSGDLAPFLDAVLGAGVDIVQLREKGLEAGEELALLEVFAAACRRHGRLLAVNDRADVALAAGPTCSTSGKMTCRCRSRGGSWARR
jgi:thiamine-phosphate pyrophosphorylase